MRKEHKAHMKRLYTASSMDRSWAVLRHPGVDRRVIQTSVVLEIPEYRGID